MGVGKETLVWDGLGRGVEVGATGCSNDGWMVGVAIGDSVGVDLDGTRMDVTVGTDNVGLEGAVEVGGPIVPIAAVPQANVPITNATNAVARHDPRVQLTRRHSMSPRA